MCRHTCEHDMLTITCEHDMLTLVQTCTSKDNKHNKMNIDTHNQIMRLFDISSSMSNSLQYNTQYLTHPLIENASSMRLDISNLYNTQILFPCEFNYADPPRETIPQTSDEAVRVFNTIRRPNEMYDSPTYIEPPRDESVYVEPQQRPVDSTVHVDINDVDERPANLGSNVSSELNDIYTKLDEMEQSQFNMNQKNNEITASMLQTIGEGKSVSAPDPYNRYEFDGYVGNQNIYLPNMF